MKFSLRPERGKNYAGHLASDASIKLAYLAALKEKKEGEMLGYGKREWRRKKKETEKIIRNKRGGKNTEDRKRFSRASPSLPPSRSVSDQ